jgi:dTDP-4-amino-4,6-dideoxygalactose transaminase
MTQNAKIPFLDLVTPHLELEDELVDVFTSALRTTAFVGGPAVEGFERDFAQFCDTRFSIGVNSGTDALRFALIAAGVQPGDVVLTVPMTFIATTEAITQAGARADFVDIDDRTYTMDPEKLRQYLETQCVLDSEKGQWIHGESHKPVTAVIPVHLYGQTVDMDPILELAAQYKMVVIEDACQAHGAEYFSKKRNRWLKAGSMGHAAAFSFYPGKNLGACGEGGAVTTNSETVARKVRMLRDHGQSKKYYHDIEGYNGRLDSIQAGILQVKLCHLADWNRKRREVAARYQRLLAPMADVVTLPFEPSWAKSNYHLYVILTAERDRLMEHLAAEGIGTGIHYPIPIHLQKPYRGLGYQEGNFPESEKAAREILSLPMYPQLEMEDQVRVAQAVREFCLARPVSGTGFQDQQSALARYSSTN